MTLLVAGASLSGATGHQQPSAMSLLHSRFGRCCLWLVLLHPLPQFDQSNAWHGQPARAAGTLPPQNQPDVFLGCL